MEEIDISTEEKLAEYAKRLEGKTLKEISDEILGHDNSPRVKTKGQIGYLVEAYFKIKMNSRALPDLEDLGIEVKSSALKLNKNGQLKIKEPLSLNMIDYFKEAECKDIKESSLYKKSKKILLVYYLHDKDKQRSEYIIKHAFLWVMDDKVLDELRPDYERIISKIRAGKATDLHQKYDKYLTTCPKHNGKFKDPAEMTSKRKQPFSEEWAEKKAFRLKNKYMEIVLKRHLEKESGL